MENKEFNRPLAVVTGASSGIGYELAKVFGENGYDLLIAAEDDGILAAAGTLSSREAQVQPLQVDLAAKDGVDRLYEKILSLDRPVDVLVVNAGVGSGGEFVNTPLDKEINLINLNVLSAMTLTKKVLRDMVARREGKILFTSSVVAESPGPYEAVYAASKAFLQSFALALRHEVKDKGVTITSLQPGATETNFFARADMLDTEVGQAEKDDPADVARQGFDALMAGKSHVIGGSFKNKVSVAGAKVMSEKQAAKMQAKPAKPQSMH